MKRIGCDKERINSEEIFTSFLRQTSLCAIPASRVALAHAAALSASLRAAALCAAVISYRKGREQVIETEARYRDGLSSANKDFWLIEVERRGVYIQGHGLSHIN